MKKTLLFCFLLVHTILLSAQEADRSALGFSALYGNHETIGGEAYFKKKIRLFRKPFELKFGANYYEQTMAFHQVKDLQINSVGLFGDIVYYPIFEKGLFIGVRAEPVNINIITEDAYARYRQESHRTFTEVFSGGKLMAQAGYQLKLGNTLRLRLYGQSGVQEYAITPLDRNENGNIFNKSEYTFRFVYNILAGVEFKLK